MARRRRRRYRYTGGPLRILLLITIIVLAVIMVVTFRALMMKPTSVTGIQRSVSAMAGTALQDNIRVTPANGREVQLQRYQSDEEKWVTVYRRTAPDSEVAKVKLEYPEDWDDQTNSKWRVVIPSARGAKKYQSKTIHVTAYNRETLKLKSSAAVIMDSKTGKILYNENMKKELPNASTTKIMTALLSMQEAEPDQNVEVTRTVLDTQMGNLYKKKGDIFKMEDLWHAMLMASSNDAATAVAEGTSGDFDTFVELMNQTALKLGATHTHFVNPSGLDAYGHYSCAYDLALIAREAEKIPEYMDILAKPGPYKFTAVNHPKRVNIVSTTDEMLEKGYEGLLGGKTGTTTSAGNCFVAYYRYDRRTYITVVLHAKNRWTATKKLFAYCREYGWGR